ncbi:MAG: HAMP domain-containing histidine kinase [Cytophagales bacterium]|nr:HAMP domain-containing histidine kinase [Cytophagales bacterium]
MRLLLKATFFYLIITMIVFGVGGIMTYDIFRKQVQMETDRYLISRLWSLQNSVENGESPFSFVSENLSIKEVDNTIEETKYAFSDTLADHPNPRISRLEPHRKLSVIRKIEEKTYKVEIFDVIVESDDIFSGVFKSQTRLFIILGAVLVISSFLMSTWLFRPFNVTLQAIKNFKLYDVSELKLQKTSTREFKELNEILKQMTKKIQADYRSLKEFSENASHEMQTPLAVAKGKIELLLQSKNLDKEHLQLINSSYEAIDHLSKMSRSLSLLTKIENLEFSDFKKINLSEKVKSAIYDFQELLELKQIHIEFELARNVMIESDPVMIQILITNLFQNAIRHNVSRGSISVQLTKRALRISNTGHPLRSSSSDLFKRFKKDDQSGETIGLGLAIAKKICEVNKFEIIYKYEHERHVIELRFSGA